MATALEQVREYTGSEYKYGFVTDVEEDRVPVGLSEDVVRQISAKKDEPAWMTEPASLVTVSPQIFRVEKAYWTPE